MGFAHWNVSYILFAPQRDAANRRRDAPPIFFLRHQKENAPRPVEKKKCSAGRSAPAQTSCRRRGKVGSPSRRSGTETPGPWGNLQPGEVWDTRCADFRCRWPVVDESLRSGPMRASASTTARAARSEAERAEREAGHIQPAPPDSARRITCGGMELQAPVSGALGKSLPGLTGSV